jgi:hypothetical protein
VAGRLGFLTRRGVGILITLAVIATAALWQLAFGEDRVEPRARPPVATATIGEGEGAVAVGPDGTVLGWLPLPEGVRLPTLPISEPPAKGELGGEVLEQARVLGAAPPALRPYIERSYYGESGVDVELRSGIELRFGDATRLAEKWKAAAAVLADPEVTALDYVDLHAPRHPATGGSGHTLPVVP